MYLKELEYKKWQVFKKNGDEVFLRCHIVRHKTSLSMQVLLKFLIIPPNH